MQLVFEQSKQTVWLFATPSELMQIAAIAYERATEATLGQSLTIIEQEISRSCLTFKISASQEK